MIRTTVFFTHTSVHDILNFGHIVLKELPTLNMLNITNSAIFDNISRSLDFGIVYVWASEVTASVTVYTM